MAVNQVGPPVPHKLILSARALWIQSLLSFVKLLPATARLPVPSMPSISSNQLASILDPSLSLLLFSGRCRRLLTFASRAPRSCLEASACAQEESLALTVVRPSFSST